MIKERARRRKRGLLASEKMERFAAKSVSTTRRKAVEEEKSKPKKRSYAGRSPIRQEIQRSTRNQKGPLGKKSEKDLKKQERRK